MNRLFASVFLFPVAGFALCPSNVSIELTDTSMRIAFETDAPGASSKVRLRYGKQIGMERQSLEARSNHPTASARFLNVTDLRPGLPRLYFDPQVSDEQGQAWSRYASCQAQLCPAPGPQPGGYACEAGPGGVLVPFVAVPEDSGKLDLPQLPRHARPNPRARPEISGEVTKLADCRAVQQAINDHSRGGTKDQNLNHEIQLPPGRICRPEQEDSSAGKNLGNYTLPPKQGSGVTIITCGGDPSEGPPPGVQYSPKFRNDRSCGFGLNYETVRLGSAFDGNGGLFLVPECNAPPCTQGWRFETLIVEAGDWRKFSPRKVAVTSVDTATGRINLAEPVKGLYAGNTEINVNLPGIRTMVRNSGNRAHADLNQRGCLAGMPSSTQLQCYGFDRMTGEYEGGGYVTAAQGYEIESCASSGADAVCTLKTAHGLGNFHSFPVSGLVGGQLEIEAEAHGWSNNATILIEGNSACDGVYVVESSPSPRSSKLARTGCSGTGGVARRLYMGRFFDLEGPAADKLLGAHLIDFRGPKQVRAVNVELDGAAIESGGFVYGNPKIGAIFSVKRSAGLTWDRVLFDIGDPFRVFNVISLYSNADGSMACDCAILDSYVNGLHFWQPITPGAGVVDGAQTYPPFSAIPVFVRAHVVKDLHMDGITFGDSAALGFFADNFGPIGPQDVTFRRLSMTMPQERVAGPGSRWLAYNSRHFIELKSGVRILFDGIQAHAWPAVGTPIAAPLFMSFRAVEPQYVRQTQDITFRNIYMRSVAFGIAVAVSGAEPYTPHGPIRRVLIDNWILDGLDYPNRQSAPHQEALNVPRTFYEDTAGGGTALMLGGPIEDVKVSRLTARRLRTKNTPNFLWLMGNRGNGIQVDRSIVSYSPSGSELDGVAPYKSQSMRLVPPIAEGGARGFFEWATWLGDPDPRSWFGTAGAPVGVIPCLSDSSTLWADFGSKNNVKSAAERAFACSGGNCGRWNVLIAGKDRQSCEEREALVLDKDLNGIGPFEGLGADTKELAKALGYIPAQITDVTPTGAKLLYAPLSEERCAVDHGRDPDFRTYIRGWDTGAEGNRGMQLGGYSSGETAYYRLLCPQAVQVSGSFTTAK